MNYFTKISRDACGKLFDSAEQQKRFLGTIESGPYYGKILPNIADTSMSIVSKFFTIKNKKFEEIELRKLYKNKKIIQIFSKDLGLAKKSGEDDESKILKKVYSEMLKILKDKNFSEYEKLNAKFGKNSISHKKAFEAIEILVDNDDNFEDGWEILKKALIEKDFSEKELPNENSVFERMNWVNENADKLGKVLYNL